MTTHRAAEERHRQIGEALLRVVAEHGLERATLRRIADAAEVSVGLVQRYFTSKDDLLRFGIEYVYERTRERAAAVPIEPPIREVVTAISASLLPLDEERVRESRVWLAFVQATLNDPAQRAVHERAIAELVEGLRRALDGARRAGELAPGLDTEREALALVAFVDGLATNGVATGTRYDAATLRALLDAYLARLFGAGAA